MQLGTTSIEVTALGVGTWAWGDTSYWNNPAEEHLDDITAAFLVSIAAGINFFDTAEIYGPRISERLLGGLMRATDRPVVVATKFFPLPWRLSASTLQDALKGSLYRLQRQQIDLYQIHWPTPLLSIPSLMDALADAVAEGKVRTVGVSNYNADQMRRAHEALARRGVPLASNQVEYSLLHREPEKNGVLDACRELNVTLIAYSPLASGMLGGKYSIHNRPSGPRRYIPRFRPAALRAYEPVDALLREIGSGHGAKTSAQVALNWLIQRGVLPIPGAKNARQAAANAGALGWTLEPDEIDALEQMTRN